MTSKAVFFVRTKDDVYLCDGGDDDDDDDDAR